MASAPPPRCTLKVRVVPNARRTEVVGSHGDAVKIKLQAPAIEGKANKALLRFLSEALATPNGTVTIRSGEKGRDKLVEIVGMAFEAARSKLLALSSGDAKP